LFGADQRAQLEKRVRHEAVMSDRNSAEAEQLPQESPMVETDGTTDRTVKRQRRSNNDSSHLDRIDDSSKNSASLPPIDLNDLTHDHDRVTDLTEQEGQRQPHSCAGVSSISTFSFWYQLVVEDPADSSRCVCLSGQLMLQAGDTKIAHLKRLVHIAHQGPLRGIDFDSIKIFSSDSEELGVSQDWNTESHGGTFANDPLIFTASRGGYGHNALLQSKCT
jgi:hypothetical protein